MGKAKRELCTLHRSQAVALGQAKMEWAKASMRGGEEAIHLGGGGGTATDSLQAPEG